MGEKQNTERATTSNGGLTNSSYGAKFQIPQQVGVAKNIFFCDLDAWLEISLLSSEMTPTRQVG